MAISARTHPLLVVAAHFALACAISWSVLFAFNVSTADDGWKTIVTNPLLLVVKFGPSLAGLIVIVLLGAPGGTRDFFRRLFDFGRPLALAGVVGFAAIATLPAAVLIALSQSIDIPVPTAAMMGMAVSWIALRSLLGGGLGEELGWRGIALPAMLEKVGPRSASLIIGFLWTIWHAPGFFGSDTPWWLLAIAQGVLTVALSFVFTWVYLRTGGSIPVAILLHGALNGFNEWAESAWMPALDDIGLWQIARILLVLVLGIIAAVAMPRGSASAAAT
jgi:membrane protease YdiL (CAAX protease family)